MTIKLKKINLKSLFLFNGILLLIAFSMIQYSAVNTDKAHAQSENYFIPVVQGRFGDHLQFFQTPHPIPNIKFQTVFDHQMDLESLKGQWVVVNLWATWCPPCVKEMPSLQNLQDLYGDRNLKVVAVSVDRKMTGKKLREFLFQKQFGAVAAYYGDYPTFKKQLDIRGLPTTYILNPDGEAVAAVKSEVDWASEDAKAFFESIL